MMEAQLIQSLLPLEIAVSLFFIIAAYLIIKLPRSYRTKLILIPLLVVFTFFTFTWFAETLGYPVHQTPKDKIIILSYRVAKVDDKKYIELWTLNPKDFSRSRLVAIPWTKEQEEQLRGAQKRRGQEGSLIIGEMKKKKQQNGNVVPFLEFKNLNPRIVAPKAGDRPEHEHR